MNRVWWALGLVLSIVAASCTTSAPIPLPTVTPPAATTVSLPPPSQLGQLPSIVEVVERVTPAVVAVYTEQVQSQFFFQGVVQGAGTGAIIRSDGYIVTNNHVIEGARQITVGLADGRTLPARLVGRDPEGDLAVIKVEAQGLPTLAFGASDALRRGDWVIAVGNAAGLQGGLSVTLGIVSAVGRTILTDAARQVYLFDVIQTDAAINEGNSGGPLVNLRGELVGINTAIQGNAQGIGFAIPSAVVEPTVAALISKGSVTRAYLGVETQALTPAIASQLGVNVQVGIWVRQVLAGTSAGRAGLKQGDILVKVGGLLVRSDAEFRRALWRFNPGDTVVIEFLRDGKLRTVNVTLGERPPSAALLQAPSLA